MDLATAWSDARSAREECCQAWCKWHQEWDSHATTAEDSVTADEVQAGSNLSARTSKRASLDSSARCVCLGVATTEPIACACAVS